MLCRTVAVMTRARDGWRRWTARLVAAAALVGVASGAAAQQGIVLNEVLGSWRGDDTIQFVELIMVANGQNGLNGRAALVFDDATGEPENRETYLFTANVPVGQAGRRVLVATTRLGQAAAITPDLVLPEGLMHPVDGRICYRADNGFGVLDIVDCVAYGDYTGPRDGFGRPVAATPDNRALVRIDDTGNNRSDWRSELEPRPQNNAGVTAVMATQCGDGVISLGEECDGADLAGETCASLGFVRGKLECRQCHFDTSRCSFCGNDELNDGEQCDGTDLDGATCEDLGFTGGTLACTGKCAFATAGCDATFYVPGKGPKKKDCVAEWLVRNEAGKPAGTGKAKPVVKCRQGDPGCDADADPATCTMPVAVCFRHPDARLPECPLVAVDAWRLVRPTEGDGSVAGAMIDAVAALGGTRTGPSVNFDPPLAGDEACTATQQIVVAVKAKLKLKAQASAGATVDPDVLTLSCRP
jgi:hypothetical protein